MKKKDLYSLLRELNSAMTRGTRQDISNRPGQNKVLKVLNKNDDIRQRELQDILGIRASSLSELLRKLEKDDYITRERSKSNGNDVIITITDKGRVSAEEAVLAEKQRDKEFFGCLSTEEREQLTVLLNKLLDSLHEADSETEGERRERQWSNKAQMQAEAAEIDKMLESVCE